jgi:hypothetical protein
MKASTAYRAAAFLLLLFAIGHLSSFSQTDPHWGLDGMIGQMRSIKFGIGGIERTYWDFFIASGLTVGILYLLSAALAWQLSRLAPETMREMRLIAWAFSLAFAGVAAVSMVHLFMIPIAFSTVITLCLLGGAWAAGRPGSG